MKESISSYRSKAVALLAYLTVISGLFVAFSSIQVPENTTPTWLFPLLGYLASGFVFYYFTALIEVPPTIKNRGIWRELSMRILISGLVVVVVVVANLCLANLYLQEAVSIYHYAIVFILVTVPGYGITFWHASNASDAIHHLKQSNNNGFNSGAGKAGAG